MTYQGMSKTEQNKAGKGNTMFKLLKKENEEISFVDVKQLYDAAYAEKDKARVNLKKFKRLLTKAMRLDALYRAQLIKTEPFRYKEAA